MKRLLSWPALLLIVGCLPGGVVHAQAASDARMASACTACHGPAKRSHGAIPSLAGMPVARFQRRIADFRAGSGTIMNRIAPAYDTAGVQRLAQYFTTLPAEPDPDGIAPR